MTTDTNAYDVGASQQVQDDFDTAAGNLEAALGRRQQDVDTAMADYQADGVSEEYAQLEQQWNSAGQQVRDVIAAIRNSLVENDDVARRALSAARASIPS